MDPNKEFVYNLQKIRMNSEDCNYLILRTYLLEGFGAGFGQLIGTFVK